MKREWNVSRGEVERERSGGRRDSRRVVKLSEEVLCEWKEVNCSFRNTHRLSTLTLKRLVDKTESKRRQQETEDAGVRDDEKQTHSFSSLLVVLHGDVSEIDKGSVN